MCIETSQFRSEWTAYRPSVYFLCYHNFYTRQETILIMDEAQEDQSDGRIRRGIERRLEFIEYRLYWDGRVNRGDIKEQFGVSVPQASNDLALYRDRAPHNIRYDASEKRYLPSDSFEPIFLKPNANHYLVELKSVSDHVLAPAEAWIGNPPSVDTMPIPGRRVDPAILRSLLEAIRTGKSIDAYYHSMSAKRPDPIWRRITPHAFGSDGLRWHARAYCHIENRFKDFILSRFIETRDFGPSGASQSDDDHWCSFFEVVLVPNPALAESKRRTVEMDYEMTDGKLTVKVRCAQLYYFNKRLRLDVGKLLDNPHEAPVVVANSQEFERVLAQLSP